MKTVAIVGVGAIGSHVVQFLRNHFEHIKIYDFDSVEAKNVASQFYTMDHQGKKKVSSLMKLLKSFWYKDVTPYFSQLNKQNVHCLDGAEVVIDCTDNYAARVLLEEYCAEKGIPCLHAGMNQDASFARVFWGDMFTPDKEGDDDGPTCLSALNLPKHTLVASVVSCACNELLQLNQKNNYIVVGTTVSRI